MDETQTPPRKENASTASSSTHVAAVVARSAEPKGYRMPTQELTYPATRDMPGQDAITPTYPATRDTLGQDRPDPEFPDFNSNLTESGTRKPSMF